MSGLFGGGGSDPNKAAMRAQKDQLARLDALELPELKKYVLENPELVGLLEAEGFDPSKLAEIKQDAGLRDNQMRALQELSDRSEEGITAEDRYAMEQLLGQVDAKQQSNTAAIEQNMARRGMDSSGAALMAKLQNKQSGANLARDRAMQMAAQGQQNRLNALSQLGAQSGQLAARDFNEKSRVASAQDAIARANAMNKQNVNSQNLAARQAIENQKTNIANMNKQVDNQLAQQDFQNRYSKTGAQGSVANSMSSIAANAPTKPGGLQSALGGASTGAGVGASFGGPVGAAWGAGIGAGVGLLSSMEDGGIAGSSNESELPINSMPIQDQSEAVEKKQRDAFKKKYIKQIHDEILASKSEMNNEPKKEPRHDNESKKMENPDIKAGYFDGGVIHDFSSNTLQENIDQGNGVILGQDNDLTSADIQTEADAQEVINSGSGISGDAIVKGIGALSKMLGDGQQTKAPLELAAYSQPEIKNILGNQQIPQFEDGGMPEYESDGNGEVIDSGEESYEGDRVDAKVNDGEMIVNLPQQQRLMDLIRGEISVDELGTDDIVEGVPREDRDEMHENANQESKMKELLEMIGGR